MPMPFDTPADSAGGTREGADGLGAVPFPREPLPTGQSVLWRPTMQELARPDADTTLIFMAQRALAAVEDHLRAAPDQALVGFLVGRVFETPDTGLPFVVVHGAVRVPQVIVGGASESVVGQSLGPAQRALPPEDGVVVGWYRSDPTGALRITTDDHQAHVRHFHRPWQIALLMTIRPQPVGTRGGVFRPVGEAGSAAPYLPFYELLDAENNRDGWKRPSVAWSNYWSPDPAVWRLRPTTELHPPSAPAARPRRFTPIPPDEGDQSHVAWRGPRGRVPRRWWIMGGAALLGAVWLGVRLGVGPGSVAPSAAGTTAPPPAPAVTPPESLTAHAVEQALDAYQLRASMFASQQMTCTELAQGLADVDDAWLRYTMAKAQKPDNAAPGDTTLPTPERRLADKVDQVEGNFERSGCPRP
ncbi:MAG TPA: hypothetical protein VM716_09655 [Gemmatimonadales bacterium]|nr:hypothetical protein [Gemmatimonadales bacterium]